MPNTPRPVRRIRWADTGLLVGLAVIALVAVTAVPQTGCATTVSGNGSTAGSTTPVAANTTPVELTYADKATGATRTVDAIPGSVPFQTEPDTWLTTVEDLVTKAGGKLAFEDTSAGLYIATVAAGGEVDLIRALSASDLVISATPDFVLSTDGPALRTATNCGAAPLPPDGNPNTGDGIQQYTIDNFKTTECESKSSPGSKVTHGDFAKSVGGGGASIDVSLGAGTNIGAALKKALPSAIRTACASGARAVINMSMGGAEGKNYADNEATFLATLAGTVNALSSKAGLDDFVVVVSTGNGDGKSSAGTGVNIAELMKFLPQNVLDHILFAGGSGEPGNCSRDSGQNFSSDGDPNVVYAPSRNIQTAGVPDDCNGATGTSFAAPQVSAAFAKFAEGRTGTTADLVKKFKDNLKANKGFLDPICNLKGTYTGTYSVSGGQPGCCDYSAAGGCTLVIASVSPGKPPTKGTFTGTMVFKNIQNKAPVRNPDGSADCNQPCVVSPIVDANCTVTGGTYSGAGLAIAGTAVGGTGGQTASLPFTAFIEGKTISGTISVPPGGNFGGAVGTFGVSR